MLDMSPQMALSMDKRVWQGADHQKRGSILAGEFCFRRTGLKINSDWSHVLALCVWQGVIGIVEDHFEWLERFVGTSWHHFCCSSDSYISRN